MNRKFTFLMMLSLAGQLSYGQTATPGRKIASFDNDWLFYKGDASGAEKSSFKDAAWRKLDVPHDWMIEGPYSQDNKTGRGGGYLPSGIGWYRKYFTLDAADAVKNVAIEFDGVMANSDVWINGYHLGKRPYGYISFNYELNGHLNFGKGKTNVIAVRADNTIQPASRYYTGAGIYRHVRLVTSNQVHISTWGVFVTTPEVSAEKATVHVKTMVNNIAAASKSVMLQTTLYDAAGKAVGTASKTAAKQVAKGDTVVFEQDIAVANPKLWSTAAPTLYKAVTQVLADGKVIDDAANSFGIRSIKFTADQGFLLNGKKLMIKGVCLHHDVGAFGSAVPLSAWERRLQALKNIGVNGIRTSHNPVAPEFLDLCDRMGFVVMDESFDTWEANKVSRGNDGGGYNLYFKQWGMIDQRDQVLRDRNHPSIVIYSVGNEIHDALNDSTGFKKYRDLQNTCHKYDPSRPVTMALFRPNVSKVYDNGFAKMMDVVGQNYRENELVDAHTAHPDWIVIGTENGHTLTAWQALRDHNYMSGQFLWVGVDYLGESDWPNVTDGQGVFDRTMGTRPLTLQRESWWSDKPVVHIVRNSQATGRGAGLVADWTPTDPAAYQNAKISVYSNCDDVELFLNGKSLGSKAKPADDDSRNWEVPYEKGSLKAVAKNGGKVVVTEELKTAGVPAKIILTTERGSIKNNWDDVAYVTAQVVDANGVPCPQADNEVTFSVSGPGAIAATDNGDLANHVAFSEPVRHAYRGKCIVIIRGKGEGKATVQASGAGLTSSSVSINIGK
ncbi:beta-galactosidase [Mucilaginibacter yixingensis]|uniref:Beta-galactosidase n=2 Tax=Mucilaginibacter yixingensis TaxID=1295612 RepID=A0A2T5JB45_9SPHI|nr:beta-galactosidase [Mucilaginibacter yixingensis]